MSSVALEQVPCKLTWPPISPMHPQPDLVHHPTPILPPTQSTQGFPAHLTRFSTAWGSKALRFWIDAAPGQVLSLTTHVAHLDATPATQEFLAQLPDWVSPVIMTTVQQKWNLEFR